MSAEDSSVSTCDHSIPASCSSCATRLREFHALFAKIESWWSHLENTCDSPEPVVTFPGFFYNTKVEWCQTVSYRLTQWIMANYNKEWARQAFSNFIFRNELLRFVEASTVDSPSHVRFDLPLDNLIGTKPRGEDDASTDADDSDQSRPSTPMTTSVDSTVCPHAPERPVRRTSSPPLSPILSDDESEVIVPMIPCVQPPAVLFQFLSQAAHEIHTKYGRTVLMQAQPTLHAHLVLARAMTLWRQQLAAFVRIPDERLRDEQHNICALTDPEESHVRSATHGIHRERRMRAVVLRHRVSSDAVEAVRFYVRKNN